MLLMVIMVITIIMDGYNLLFNEFCVQLLDYSAFLKARYDELVHDSITLHDHELIQK